MSLFRTKDLDLMISSSQSDSGLKRTLGAMDLTLLGVGAIVGTGIFVLTGTGAVQAGPGLSLSESDYR